MSTDIQVVQPARQLSKPQNSISIFQPTSLAEAWEFAKILADSGMVPKAYVGKPAAIISTWQLAMELNVGLMQGLQGVSNINGTPAVFGDLGWALVQNHPDFVDAIEDLQDTQATCTLKRRGRTDVTRKYTLDMAKNAALLGKDNWKNHPRRMLQWRARSWAMRDLFADALKGMVIYEEAQDYADTIDAPEPPKIQATVAVPTAEAKPAESAPVTQPVAESSTGQTEVPATLTMDQQKAFFKAYSASGHLVEEARAWVQETFKVPDSRSIKAVDFDVCMAWASTPKPKPEPEREPWTGTLENMDAEPA